MSGDETGPMSVSSAEFSEAVLESGKPVVVDFWAEWCAPCRIMHPVFENLNRMYSGKALFVRVNIDESPDLAVRYGVMAVPTFLVFVGGKPVERIVGACGEATLKKAIDNHLLSQP